jgi:hypothetical protein
MLIIIKEHEELIKRFTDTILLEINKNIKP